MLKFYSAANNVIDPKLAVKEAIAEGLGNEDPKQCKLIIFHATIGHDFKQLAKAFKKNCPNARITGCSGSGVIGTRFVSEKMRALAVMFVYGEDSEFSCVGRSKMNFDNCKKLAKEAAQELFQLNKNINMICILSSGLASVGDSIIEGIEEVFSKEIPIFGAISCDNFHSKMTYEVLDEKVMVSNGLVLIGFSDPTLKVYREAHHGTTPTHVTFKPSNFENNKYIEINEKPAWHYFMSTFNKDNATDIGPDTLAVVITGIRLSPELAKDYDNEFILRPIIQVDQDHKACYAPATIPKNHEITFMERNEDKIFSGIDVITSGLQQNTKGKEIVAVFHADCAARGRYMFNTMMKEEIVLKMQNPIIQEKNIPWLGIYGYGEYGRLGKENVLHNFTTDLTVIVRENERK